MQRPTGITILAVLAAIGGILGIIGAFALFALGAIGAGLGAAVGVSQGFLAGGFAVFWGLVTLVMGVFDLILAYGAWFLKPWAWILGIGVEALAILVAIVNLIGGRGFFGFLFSVAIAGVIIYYLYTPEVRRVFGRA